MQSTVFVYYYRERRMECLSVLEKATILSVKPIIVCPQCEQKDARTVVEKIFVPKCVPHNKTTVIAISLVILLYSMVRHCTLP